MPCAGAAAPAFRGAPLSKPFHSSAACRLSRRARRSAASSLCAISSTLLRRRSLAAPSAARSSSNAAAKRRQRSRSQRARSNRSSCVEGARCRRTRFRLVLRATAGASSGSASSPPLALLVPLPTPFLAAARPGRTSSVRPSGANLILMLRFILRQKTCCHFE